MGKRKRKNVGEEGTHVTGTPQGALTCGGAGAGGEGELKKKKTKVGKKQRQKLEVGW